jgi:hypothetical protein
MRADFDRVGRDFDRVGRDFNRVLFHESLHRSLKDGSE